MCTRRMAASCLHCTRAEEKKKRMGREREREKLKDHSAPALAAWCMDGTAAADAILMFCLFFTHNIPSVVISLLHTQAWCVGPHCYPPISSMKVVTQQAAGLATRDERSEN